MASELKVDKFTGVTTAGSISVTGEGNSTTTNLQQGLAKCWVNANMSGTAGIYDSFNTASLTDSAVGKAVVVFTTAMSNANYSVSLAIGENFSEPNINSTSTANYEVWVYDEGASAYKDVTTHSSVLGDSA